MRHQLTLTLSLLMPLGLIGCLATGCSDSSNGGGQSVEQAHANIVLMDAAGTKLTSTSTEPYSPRQTCGACHDVDKLANGYHFQQGRTDEAGNIIVAADYFGDGRSYIHSPGMYGKW